MERRRFWYDRDLIHPLSTLDVTGYDFSETDDGLVDISLTVSLDPVHSARLVEERAEFLTADTGSNPSVETVVEQIVGEIGIALDIEYNTVGFSSADNGEYKQINDQQWSKCEDAAVYDRYSELLYDLTGEDVDFDEHHPSIPGLREPFLQAVAASDDHELPPPGAVREIIGEHINQLREKNQSRAAVSALKQELEQKGVDPRTASSVAKNMDDFLLTDEELAQRNNGE